MADPVYVTTGPWGAGGGLPLDADEIDTNFYRLVQRLVSLETDPPTGPYPTSITLAGTSFTMGLSNGSTLGPITFTIPMPRWRGDWLPSTTYHPLDFFRAPGGELGAVLYEHVSESSFDWSLEVDTSGDLAYRNISGSATGTLDGLAGVVLTSPADGEYLKFDGTNWVNGAGASEIDDLTDVTLTDPQNFDDLTYDWDLPGWRNRPHRDVIPVPHHPGVFSSNEAFFYYVFPRAAVIPANFTAVDGYQSRSGATANATGTTVITINRAAAADLADFSEVIGTISIASGQKVGSFATAGGTEKGFSAGDVLRLRAPSSADGTFAGFYATLIFMAG